MACHFHPSTRARLSFLLPIPVFFRWPHTAPTPNVSHGQPLEGFINHSRIAARIHPGVHGLSLSPLWVPVAACHLCVPLPACNLYVPLPPCHLSVPLPACHSSVLLPACHLCVSVPALREGASRRRRSAGVCPGRAPGGPRRSRVPWGSSSGPGRAPGRCVPAVRSCCAGPAGPCTRSAASSPTACSTTTTAQPCPAERSAAGKGRFGGLQALSVSQTQGWNPSGWRILARQPLWAASATAAAARSVCTQQIHSFNQHKPGKQSCKRNGS